MTDTTRDLTGRAPARDEALGRSGGGPIQALVRLAQDAAVPDFLSRLAIHHLVAGARRSLESAPPDAAAQFAEAMADGPIATHTADANAQHYELPAAFFEAVLGPHLKYSSGLYAPGVTTLAQAEAAALRETESHADLRDGQAVLELGCGWGSLSLWMAERFPASTITAVSNSTSQRAFIQARAAERGLTNLSVVTADMNVFDTARRFDRVVSVEMFEHMSNWRDLLARVRSWLKPDGLLFLHVFSHADTPYRFETEDPDDWIARHFFSGGIMPSHDLIRQFPDLFEVAMDWRWSGDHYARTALHWLERFDAARDVIDPLLAEVYGPEARIWRRRWRLFFLATAGLFGHRGGAEWGVSHYRLRPVA
ncbi:class I SAM-dependent methyltransferase [Caulobacter sp. 602-2]|uniref:Class I SAM-dependent methyltransferase n=1 Tax=Caulobacter sp. 602-2 TaxID=2710887 RepID=A0A6G4QVZ2_9CAUL|nr:cyclopropane-fatty-acyl-phospholipid synthase family protein [Caulobacter sp. 602-2]NGM49118.1 class I SAM-dependent methyltransferase [Caulobacter sp. 602-2]